jgi:hypothetical protein
MSKMKNRKMTVPEAAQTPMQAYADDDGSNVVYVIDHTGPETFVAVRDLKGRWRVPAHGPTDNGLKGYHLVRDYAEVVHLATAARRSLMPTLAYGSYESHPAIFTNAEAWVFLGGDWRSPGPFEVSFGASIMSKEKFEKTYGKLPPLPERAFAT